MRFFETIGNAIIIAYDDGPVLTTDAWINDHAYFGRWRHDYEVPTAQLQAIRKAKYHWFSHGHPDHLNIASLPMLTKGELLVSDHYGGRIKRDLAAAGYQVRILPEREWVQLSKAIRVCSFGCYQPWSSINDCISKDRIFLLSKFCRYKQHKPNFHHPKSTT